MKVNAWIQMGCERREATFDVSEAEIETVGENGLEMYIEDQVHDWIRCPYGWGWTCELIKNHCLATRGSPRGCTNDSDRGREP